MDDYVNLKKSLTTLLKDASIDEYVGLPSRTLAEYLINELDKLKRQLIVNRREDKL